MVTGDSETGGQNFVVMKVLSICATQCGTHWAHVPVEQLQCGWWDPGTEVLVVLF